MAIINKLTDVADAIREKTGKTASMKLAEMPAEIRSIETGGSNVEALYEIDAKAQTSISSGKTCAVKVIPTGINGEDVSAQLGTKALQNYAIASNEHYYALGSVGESDNIWVYNKSWVKQPLTYLNGNTEYTGPVYDVCFSPNGRYCVFATDYGPMYIAFDTTTTPWTQLAYPSSWVQKGISMGQSLCFSPDGRYLIVGCYKSSQSQFVYCGFMIYDTSTTPWTFMNSSLAKNITTYSLGQVGFTRDGRYFVGASSNISPSVLYIYDTTTTPWTKKADPEGHTTDSALGFTLSPTADRCLVYGGAEPFTALYDTSTIPWTKMTQEPLCDGWVASAQFSHDGNMCAVSPNSGSKHLEIYDTTTDNWTTKYAPTPTTNGGASMSWDYDDGKLLYTAMNPPRVECYQVNLDDNNKVLAQENGTNKAVYNMKYGIAKNDADIGGTATIGILID